MSRNKMFDKFTNNVNKVQNAETQSRTKKFNKFRFKVIKTKDNVMEILVGGERVSKEDIVRRKQENKH